MVTTIGIDPHKATHTAVAIAALRHSALALVRRDDHAQVLRMLAKRHLELTALRTQAVCRLQALLARRASRRQCLLH